MRPEDGETGRQTATSPHRVGLSSNDRRCWQEAPTAYRILVAFRRPFLAFTKISSVVSWQGRQRHRLMVIGSSLSLILRLAVLIIERRQLGHCMRFVSPQKAMGREFGRPHRWHYEPQPQSPIQEFDLLAEPPTGGSPTDFPHTEAEVLPCPVHCGRHTCSSI
jgi:hypothetical protein